MIHQRNTAHSMNTHPSMPESVDLPAKSVWRAQSTSFPPKGTPSKQRRSDEGVVRMLRGIPPPPLGVYSCGDRSDEPPADAKSPCGRGGGGRGSAIAAALSMGLAAIALVLAAADRWRSPASSMSDQIIRLTDELSTLRSIETGLTLDLDEEKKHSQELSRREEEERRLLHDRDIELEKRREELSRREDEERMQLRVKERELEELRDELREANEAKARLERESRGGKVRGAKPKAADEGAVESDYALLFPNANCVGTPIRIDYSSSEQNCEHCRDFCSLTFKSQEGRTANLANQTSMLAVGGRSVEIVHMCLGQFAYEEVDTLNVLRPGEGCANLGAGAAHARFM